ncbi:hypothetical protein MTO96_047591 [Rhipicephalus appendiculatus]
MLLWRSLLLFVLRRCVHLSCRPRLCPFRESAVELRLGHLTMLHLCLAIKCAVQQVASEAGGRAFLPNRGSVQRPVVLLLLRRTVASH